MQTSKQQGKGQAEKANVVLPSYSSVQKFKTPYISLKRSRNKRPKPAKLGSFIHFALSNMLVNGFTHLDKPSST